MKFYSNSDMKYEKSNHFRGAKKCPPRLFHVPSKLFCWKLHFLSHVWNLQNLILKYTTIGTVDAKSTPLIPWTYISWSSKIELTFQKNVQKCSKIRTKAKNGICLIKKGWQWCYICTPPKEQSSAFFILDRYCHHNSGYNILLPRNAGPRNKRGCF